MSRPITRPDLTTLHYTRVSGTGEAANRVSRASWGGRRYHPTQKNLLAAIPLRQGASMFKRLVFAAAFGTVVGALGAPANAGVVYDESVSGDFSNLGLSPTAVSFALGSNQIFGTTGKSAAGIIDRDYFTFTVPTGEVLASLTVLPGTTSLAGSLGALSFIGLQAGNEVTLPTNATSAAGLLGWDHYSPGDIDTDILPTIGTGLGATDFVPPLGAGDYAVWVQDTGTGTANYGFDFVVANVPEPASWTMMLFGLIGLAQLRLPRRLPASRHTIAARKD